MGGSINYVCMYVHTKTAAAIIIGGRTEITARLIRMSETGGEGDGEVGS